MIFLEDWALIRRLHRSEGLSQRAIARQLGIARDTVAAALAADGPPKYQRVAVASAINAVEPRIRALLSAYPQMPATVIAERVGWTGSISWFRERVRAICPEYFSDELVDGVELSGETGVGDGAVDIALRGDHGPVAEEFHEGVDSDVGVGELGGESVAKAVHQCAGGALTAPIFHG